MNGAATVPRGQRPPTFDAVEVGMELGPARVVADEHLVRAYSFAQDDYNPWYYEASPFSKPMVPPGMLANELLLLYYYQFRQADCTAIHTHEQLSFHDALFHDEHVVITGRYVEKYTRRENGYVVIESEARTDDGRLLATHRGTEIMEGRLASIKDSPARPAEHLESVVPVLRKLARSDQVAVFSNIGKQQKNIHNDAAFAHDAGLSQPVVQGMQQACYLIELGTAAFGADMLVSGTLDLRFISPLYVESAVDVGGSVTRQDDHGGELDCWVSDGKGHISTVGTITVGSDTSSRAVRRDSATRREDLS